MKKRIISCLLLIALLFSLSGCNSRTVETSIAETTYPEPEQVVESWRNNTDPVTLTFSSAAHKLVGGILWKEDEISRAISDMTGVTLLLQHGAEEINNQDIDLDETGKKNYLTYLDILTASGELSDLVYLTDDYDIKRMADADMAAPLDELMTQYCPDFEYSIDEKELISNTASDGHIYTLRSGYAGEEFYSDPSVPVMLPYPMAIRTDILAKLEADMPASIEELEGLLYRVKEIGAKYTILVPMVCSYIYESPIPGWMGIYNTNTTEEALYWDEAAQSIITPMGNPAWREYLLKMNQWFRDGLITITGYEGGIKVNPSMADTGPYNVAAGDSIRSFARIDPWQQVSDSIYTLRENPDPQVSHPYPFQIVSQPLTWQGEDRSVALPVSHQFAQNGGLFISKTCYNKERAILFYQFLRSEDGAKLTRWGIEGVHYTLDENGHVVMTEGNTRPTYHLVMNGLSDLNLNIPSGVGYWTMVTNPLVENRYAASPIGAESNADIIMTRQMLIEAGTNYKKQMTEEDILPLGQVALLKGDPGYDDYQRLWELWKEGIHEVVMASSQQQAESRWDQLQDELNRGGINELQRLLTQRFKDVLIPYQSAGYYTDIKIE